HKSGRRLPDSALTSREPLSPARRSFLTATNDQANLPAVYPISRHSMHAGLLQPWRLLRASSWNAQATRLSFCGRGSTSATFADEANIQGSAFPNRQSAHLRSK